MIEEFPLYLFTVLGGIAAGSYGVGVLFPMEDSKRRWALKLVSLALLAIGGIALLFHLGHPERMLYAFSNPQAGITLEGYATALFGVMLVVDIVMEKVKGETPVAVRAVGGIAALLLTIAMGYAYTQYIATPVWTGVNGLVMCALCSAATGFALNAAVDHDLVGKSAYRASAIAVQALAAVDLIWLGIDYGLAGLAVMPFIIAAVLDVAACALTAIAKPKSVTAFMYTAFACAAIAYVVARYAFYCV